MKKEIYKQDDDDADAILPTGAIEVEEELENLSGYHEYLREQDRLNEN